MNAKHQNPPWLEAVLAEVPPSSVAFPDETQWLVNAMAGELRAAQPMDHDDRPARLVLILEAYTDDDPWANACLIAEASEVAGDRDVLLGIEETDLSFPVLVETDVVGPLFMVQLGPRLGQIDGQLLDELKAAVYGTWRPGLATKRGIPIMKRSDARWRLKGNEVDAMQRLSAHCLAHLVAGETQRQAEVIIDPVLFEPDVAASPISTLLKVASLAERERLTLSSPAELREGDRLRDWIASLGPDEWRALEPIWQGSLRTAEVDPVPRAADADWHSHWPAPHADILARQMAAEARRGRRAFRVLTSASLWGDQAGEVSRGAVGSLHVDDVGRVQVKPELVEEAA